MTLMSEITRVSNNIAAAYTALDGKGATLPETQNSANLADTIDTISTGGGGGSYNIRPSIFDTLDSMCDSYNDETTWKKYKEDGWIAINSDVETAFEQNSTSTVYDSFYKYGSIKGFVFTDDMANVLYIDPSTVCCIKIPNDAVVEANGGYYKVTFAQNTIKWICFILKADGNDRIVPTIKYSTSSVGDYDRDLYIPFVKYLSIKSFDPLYTNNNPYIFNKDGFYDMGAFNFNMSNLVDFYCPNIKMRLGVNSTTHKISLSDVPYFFFMHNQSLDIKKFVNTFCDDAVYGETIIEDGYLLFTDSYKQHWLAATNSIPFILDCSGDSTSRTVYIGSQSPFSSTPYNCHLLDTIFIIPSSQWNLKFKASSPNIVTNTSLESIEILANNAPNVSGKTINLPGILKNYIEAVKPSIISTLTSKGYTVS